MVNRLVLEQRATRGNVENELAEPHPGAGCGCGYPEWVGDAEVERSNRILERLRRTAKAPPKALATAPGAAAARGAFRAANVRVFASSHTCLPVLQGFGGGDAGGARVIANNGAAGMPNFRATGYGLATRIAVQPSPRALYAARAGRVRVEAQPIDYDRAAWERRFLELWPQGSEAHRSYYDRIAHGPRDEAAQPRRAEEPVR